MAYVLLIDGSETAQMAMRGILARGSHRVATCRTAAEGWEFLHRNVRVDLVITELRIEGGGLGLVERLKDDTFLKLLPILVYTDHADRATVQRALLLGVQNLLLKPYHDEAIFGEIRKAVTNPWRARHFEEERTFCKMMGYEPAQLQTMLQTLRTELGQAATALRENHRDRATKDARARLLTITEHAEAAGFWGAVEFMGVLNGLLDAEAWDAFAQALPILDYAERLIIHQLNPDLVAPDFLSDDEHQAIEEAREQTRWFNALAAGRVPVIERSRIMQEVEALPGCPVIDSVAASFQMAATGHPSSLQPLMDLASRDPGLAAQMLIAASQLKHAVPVESGPLTDPSLAVGLLGEQRLAGLARNLVQAPERLMQMPPSFSWTNYWMFQFGVARMARYTCGYLGLQNLATTAFYAGLLHDLGKLLLLRLHPFALQAALDHVRRHGGTMRAAEQSLVGCTTREMAVLFAEKQGLAPEYTAVMRWIDDPEQAGAHAELAAVVSLARDLCLHNHVGFCGDTPKDQAPPLAETREWRVLRETVFPSFNLHNFEIQVHADCRELKLELHGRQRTFAAA